MTKMRSRLVGFNIEKFHYDRRNVATLPAIPRRRRLGSSCMHLTPSSDASSISDETQEEASDRAKYDIIIAPEDEVVDSSGISKSECAEPEVVPSHVSFEKLISFSYDSMNRSQTKRKRLRKKHVFNTADDLATTVDLTENCQSPVKQAHIIKKQATESTSENTVHERDSKDKWSSTSSPRGVSKSDVDVAMSALTECLQISDTMCEELVRRLGGSKIEDQLDVRRHIRNGRCCMCRTLNWPGPYAGSLNPNLFKIKEYQKAGLQWLMALHDMNRNGILADEMGLGKTAQTCVFLCHLYSSGLVRNRPTIISAPASLLDNWIIELNTWAPNLSVVKYHGKQTERREIALDIMQRFKCINSEFQVKHNTEKDSTNCFKARDPMLESGKNPYDVIVSSMQTLTNKWDEQYIRELKPVAYLVVDEAHALKNKDALSYRKLNRVIKCDRRLLLTGSPIQNHTCELRNLLLFLMPNLFDTTSLDLAMESFAKQYAGTTDKNSRGNLEWTSTPGGSNDINLKSTYPASSNIWCPIKPNIHDVLRQTWNSSAVQDDIDQIESDLSNSSFGVATNSKMGFENEESQFEPEVICLQRILSPFILRRLKSEVLSDLPPKESIIDRCVLTPRQKELYLSELQNRNSTLAKSLLRKTEGLQMNIEVSSLLKETQLSILPRDSGIHEDLKEPTSNAGNKKFVNSMIARLRRVCNHTLLMQGYYSKDDLVKIIDFHWTNVESFKGNAREKIEAEIQRWSDYEIHQQVCTIPELSWARIPAAMLLDSGKILRMIEIIDEHSKEEKCLIFTQFTSYLDIINEVLLEHRKNIRAIRLDGTTTISERQEIVDRFNTDESIRLFLLSTKAGGQGLNLTAATIVILMDQDWNPQNDRQAEDRVHRLGQKKPVTVYRLCCKGTIEESILGSCKKKLVLDEAFGGNTVHLRSTLEALDSPKASIKTFHV